MEHGEEKCVSFFRQHYTPGAMESIRALFIQETLAWKRACN